MSDLPKCLLCGCDPKHYEIPNGRRVGCSDVYCDLGHALMWDRDWIKLMGRGEPVAWQFYDPGTGRWHDFMNEQHRRNTADAGYEIRALYTQAPAVSSDPARFRQIGFTRIDRIGRPSAMILSDTKYRSADDAGVYVPVFVDEGESQAPAVDGAVLRDAERYRWLRDSGHLGEWHSAGLGHLEYAQRIDTDIDSAIKGEGWHALG